MAPAKPEEEVVQFGLRVPRSIREAVTELADEERRSINTMAIILFEEALAARGKWPVKD